MTLLLERELIREVALVGALAWFLAAGVVFAGGPAPVAGPPADPSGPASPGGSGPDWKWWLKLAVAATTAVVVGAAVYYLVGSNDSTPPGGPATAAVERTTTALVERAPTGGAASPFTRAAIEYGGPALVDDLVRPTVELSSHFANCDPNLVRQVLADPARAARAEAIYDYFSEPTTRGVRWVEALNDTLYIDQVRFAHWGPVRLLAEDHPRLAVTLRHARLPAEAVAAFKPAAFTPAELADFALCRSHEIASPGALEGAPYHPVASLRPLANHIVELARAAEETAAANLVELNRFARLLPDSSGDHRFFDEWKKMFDQVARHHQMPPFPAEEISRYFTVQLGRVLTDGDRRLQSVAFELALAGQPVPTDSMMLGLHARLFDVLHLETYKLFAHHQFLHHGMTVNHLAVRFREGYALEWVRSVIERHGDLPGVEPFVERKERIQLFRECAVRAASSVGPDDFKGFYQNLQASLVREAELMRRTP